MAGERARQQRLERKARRRREKRVRLPPRAAPLLVSFGSGLPKMSETLVAFAEPLLANVPEVEARWRAELHTAATVWNGLVSGFPEAEIVATLQRTLDPSVDGLGLVRCLTERKQRLFAGDQRIIFDVRTQQTGERVHVMAASGLVR
jgi:hypothetical protein